MKVGTPARHVIVAREKAGPLVGVERTIVWGGGYRVLADPCICRPVHPPRTAAVSRLVKGLQYINLMARRYGPVCFNAGLDGPRGRVHTLILLLVDRLG